MKKLLYFLPIAAVAGNLFPNPGFETWDRTKNLPDSVEWHWDLPKGQNAFAVFEQNSKEKHSGKYSLHLKDQVGGKCAQSVTFPLTLSQLRAAAGKVLRFSAWCKQISASRPKSVGLGIMMRTSDGKTQWRNARIDAVGQTDWTFLETKIMIPSNCVFLRLSLDCASGWGNTAEAYFDDVSVTIGGSAEKVPAVKPVKTNVSEKEHVFVVPKDTKYRLSLLSDLGSSWRIRCWGGLNMAPHKNNMPLEFEIQKDFRPYAGFFISSSAINRGFDLTDQPIAKQSFTFVMNQNIPVQVKLSKTGFFLRNGTRQANGLYLYEFPLPETKEPLNRFCGATFQFPTKLLPGKLIFSQIGIRSAAGNQTPLVNKIPDELKRFLTVYQQEKSWHEDGFSRPEIRNGTFYANGKPVFYVGPWIYNRIKTDWGRGSNPLNIKHIAYTTPPSKKVFDAMGFNSTQISAAWTLPGHAMYGLPIPVDLEERTREIEQFYRGFEGVPLVLDFAFSDADSLKKENPAKYRELDQRNSYWHEFVPFCPEHPEGAKFYDDYFKGGVKSALLNNGNVFVYELFNESSYFCACRWNIAEFAKRMRKKYNTIKNANNRWNTIFDSFEDLSSQTDLHQFQGVWPDWCKFTADRYVELLKHQKSVIRDIDKRKNVYFTEQLSGGNVYTEVGSGMDYRKIADAMDIVTYEGGIGYGKKEEISRQGMEAIVFSRCSEIWFYSAFFSAISKNQKPVLNNEHYCKRSEHGVRVPSKREDMITSLWGELFRGVSGNFSYSWDKRSWEWKTFEQAKKNVLLPSYKGAGLLNPYNWPVDQLDAFERFRKELEPFREQVLPMPRTRPATVALFFSYPTLRMLSYHRFDFRKRVVGWFASLIENQYPVQIVFEEELQAGLPENIQVLIVPCAIYATPETVPAIQEFTKRGGLVIAGTDSFMLDEYGAKLNAPLNCIRLNADSPRSLQELPRLLNEHKISRHASLESLDGGKLTGTRVDMIDRGSFKMILATAMDDLEPRFAKLHIFLNKNDHGKYYLADIITRRLYTHNGKECWTARDLMQGLALPLPPQERVLLTLTIRKPENMKAVDAEKNRSIFKEMQQKDAVRAKTYRELEEKRLRQEYELRNVDGVNPAKCVPLDLRHFANMAFKDEVSGDKKGGWFDQGSNDFSLMPLGKQVLAKVPFTIIDPASNHGKSAVILRGWKLNWLPKEQRDIRICFKVRRIYFLHAYGWDPPEKVLVLTYRIHYQDGSHYDIPCRAGNEIGGWWGLPALKSAKIALERSNVLSNQINLQCFPWNNPFPEKMVRSIDVISAASDAVPAIVAITAEKK